MESKINYEELEKEFIRTAFFAYMLGKSDAWKQEDLHPSDFSKEFYAKQENNYKKAKEEFLALLKNAFDKEDK